MCGRVVAGGLTTIDVLVFGEDEMVALGIFVEPQLPMTHLRPQTVQEDNQCPENKSGFGSGLLFTIGRRR